MILHQRPPLLTLIKQEESHVSDAKYFYINLIVKVKV
jgi:hypothetical protein